jgi:hypothetical protein
MMVGHTIFYAAGSVKERIISGNSSVVFYADSEASGKIIGSICIVVCNTVDGRCCCHTDKCIIFHHSENADETVSISYGSCERSRSSIDKFGQLGLGVVITRLDYR